MSGRTMKKFGPTTPLISHTNYRRAHDLFHRLWTKAVGTPGYDKRQWQDLNHAIETLALDGPGGSP